MNIRLVMLGKTRREELRALVDDYAKRIARYTEIEIRELRDGSPAELRKLATANRSGGAGKSAAAGKLKIGAGATVVLLDAAGKQFTSQQFAKWLGHLRDTGTREVVFLCGDASGFPEEVRAGARQTISLSTLTMPHEFARVVLAEQIYRAFAILAGHPYPK